MTSEQKAILLRLNVVLNRAGDVRANDTLILTDYVANALSYIIHDDLVSAEVLTKYAEALFQNKD